MSALLLDTTSADAPVPTITISLESSDRSVLHTRIGQRFDQMLKQGLIEEVRTLHIRKDLHVGLPAVRCVGYRQIWSMLDGEITLEQAREQSITATRQLAKRQITWLRSQPSRHVVDALSSTAGAQVLDLVAQHHPTKP